MSERLRLLIADDHPVYRDGLRALLGSLPSVEIVGEAIDGDEAVLLAQELEPNVVLMDLGVPKLNGSRPPGRSRRRIRPSACWC